jgi:hypothetical protein
LQHCPRFLRHSRPLEHKENGRLKAGRAATLTHDYKRHGTPTLFAALSTLDGSVIARCAQRHRHTEWLQFLRQINRETPQDKDLHLICDNYATHKHPNVHSYLGASSGPSAAGRVTPGGARVAIPAISHERSNAKSPIDHG